MWFKGPLPILHGVVCPEAPLRDGTGGVAISTFSSDGLKGCVTFVPKEDTLTDPT